MRLDFGGDGESKGSLQLIADEVLEGTCCDATMAEGFV